jgi:hypothetical protein
MHVKTGLLNSVGEIGARQCEILKAAHDAPVVGGVGKKLAVGSRELRGRVDRCR